MRRPLLILLGVALADVMIPRWRARAQESAARARVVSDTLAVALTAGRAAIHDLRFADGTDRVRPEARALLKRLAKAINATSGTYVIEAHVEDSGDGERDRALSERRAVEVKALLLYEGIPPERLVAVGYGATRPTAPPTGNRLPRANARIELVRVR